MADDIEEDMNTPKSSDAKSSQQFYKVYKGAKIAVSKHQGNLWKSRKDSACKVSEKFIQSGNQAIDYYKHDQLKYNNADNNVGLRDNRSRLGNGLRETENLVFSNTTTMLPVIYAKNPTVEFTPAVETSSDQLQLTARMYERLINVLLSKQAQPGVNLKPKARKGVLGSLLTNRYWAYTGYQTKDGSLEQATEELIRITEELANATDQSQILKLEGQLMAIEKKVDALSPEGPFVKILKHDQLLVDPDSVEPDYSDAKYMMHYEYLPTEYLVATYAEEQNDEAKSIFQSTHIMRSNTSTSDALQNEIDNFSLLDDDDDDNIYKEFGFSDKQSFDRSKMTKVWYVWDVVTRRMLLFSDKNWTWPIWVWDDPYNYDTFFPYDSLEFVAEPVCGVAKGEVVYYLDQQDAINEINSESRRARRWARKNVLFDKNATDQQTVESVLKGDDDSARGVNVPEGKRLEDVIFSFSTPSIKFPELFDKTDKYRAIDRISSVNEIIRGGQFKTNTTNFQAEQITNSAGIRVEEKIDIIEDWIGRIGWKLAQVCAQFMSKDTVVDLIGSDLGSQWQTMSGKQLSRIINMRVIGGSSTKPTSQAKKQETLQLGQVVGQFANSIPAAGLILLKMFSRAFDDMNISSEEWDLIIQSMQQQAQQGNTSPQQQQQLQSQELSPEEQQVLQTAVQQGVPENEAVNRIIQLRNQSKP